VRTPSSPSCLAGQRNSLDPQRKKTIIQLFILLLLTGLLYAPLFPELWRDWDQDPNYSYGIFVPILAGFLLWHNRKEIRAIDPVPWGPGLLVVLFGLFLYLLGTVANELFTMRFSMVVVLLGILLTVLGKEGTQPLLFPVLYLLCMIPLPYIVYYALAFPMKLFATRWSVIILDLLRVSVYREGNIIHLPNTTLEVANACSGLRSLMSLFTFGLAFAYLVQKRPLFRGTLVLAVLPIAVLSNIFRIVLTALLAVYKDPETAHGFLHETSGIVVYTVATLLLFAVNEALQRIRLGRDQNLERPLAP